MPKISVIVPVYKVETYIYMRGQYSCSNTYGFRIDIGR